MELIILGSGTCVPSQKRASPANFLKIGKTNILVDCGPGTLRQLEKTKHSYKDIDLVFITHFHSDHISDLDALVFARKRDQYYQKVKPIKIIGPKGMKRFYNTHLTKIIGTTPKFKIDLVEINGILKFKDFQVKSEKMTHTKESIAYKFIENKKTLIITGDCILDKKIINFSKDASVLLADAAYPEKSKVSVHLSSKEAAILAKEANVKKLVLTHLYPVKKETRLTEAKKIFKNTVLAKDLMRITV